MSANDNEELIDYEDEHDVVPNGASALATNGAAAASGAAGDDGRRDFSGIHSTGFRYAFVRRCFASTSLSFSIFRDFLLKPELLRAISDLGFEHPSEGKLVCEFRF